MNWKIGDTVVCFGTVQNKRKDLHFYQNCRSTQRLCHNNNSILHPITKCLYLYSTIIHDIHQLTTPLEANYEATNDKQIEV